MLFIFSSLEKMNFVVDTEDVEICEKIEEETIEENLDAVLPSTIIKETWSIREIVDTCIFSGWEKFFEEQKEDLYFISDVLEKKCSNFLPRRRNIFRIFEIMKPKDISVVIVGQDPYHTVYGGEPIASGITFSVGKNFKIPPSLRSIYEELKLEYGDEFEKPTHGDLTGWCEQGVFLINMALTVEEGAPSSHMELWEQFSINLINYIKKINKNVYILLGKTAIGVKKHIGKFGFILESTHPSPFSARMGFLGSNIFTECNDILLENGSNGINWSYLP